MLPQLALLKYLLTYKNFTEYRQHVTVPKELKEIKQLYYCLDLLHEKFPDKDQTLDELEIMVHAAYPQMRQVEKDNLATLISKLHSLEINDGLIELLLHDAKRRGDAQSLALAALEVAEGRSEAATLFNLAKKYSESEKDSISASEDSLKCFVTDDLFELENHTIHGDGLSWRLACLNRSLGPLRPGDFGFVFARPETGKTTFLADQVTFMAQQAKGPIIWFNNEEQGEKVRIRTYQAALALTLPELWIDKKKNLDRYRELTKNQLMLYDDASIHKKEVEAIVKKHAPSVVIFDQIDKIKGFDADRPDLVLGKVYQWARELAKTYKCAVIGVCQSDGTGEGVRWLTMSHVAEAKTSKQGEADWILGIGKSNESGTEDIRYLNISKNKLLGDKDTDPNERHGRYFVMLRPQIARYEDLPDE